MLSDIKRDKNYLDLCNLVAENSKCLSRKVGAVLVRDNCIISTGYNGPPRKFPHCNERYLIDPKLREALKDMGKDPDDPENHKICPRYVLEFKSGEGLDWCVAGHGERNALINAARNGISTKDTFLYMNCKTPCTPCLVEIINSGVVEIITTGVYYYDISAEYIVRKSEFRIRGYHLDPNFITKADL